MSQISQILTSEKQNTFQPGYTPAHPLPNSFAGLMEMYEVNYIYIRKLCGDRISTPSAAVSRVPEGMDLHLQVLIRTKYTSTIALTHYFTDSEAGPVAYPDIKLRIYYDSLQAEVLPRCCHLNLRAFSHDAAHFFLLKRWRMNRFLFKWLSYCDWQGHSFRVDSKSRQNHLFVEDMEVPLQNGSFNAHGLLPEVRP